MIKNVENTFLHPRTLSSHERQPLLLIIQQGGYALVFWQPIREWASSKNLNLDSRGFGIGKPIRLSQHPFLNSNSPQRLVLWRYFPQVYPQSLPRSSQKLANPKKKSFKDPSLQWNSEFNKRQVAIYLFRAIVLSTIVPQVLVSQGRSSSLYSRLWIIVQSVRLHHRSLGSVRLDRQSGITHPWT